MSIHSLCFEQNYEKYQNFLSKNFQFMVVKFSVYLNRHVFVMQTALMCRLICIFAGCTCSALENAVPRLISIFKISINCPQFLAIL